MFIMSSYRFGWLLWIYGIDFEMTICFPKREKQLIKYVPNISSAAWAIIYLVTIKGVKSSGKVVYVTGTLPYIMLTIFVIRGITLPGSMEGLRYYLLPEWSRLTDPKVLFLLNDELKFTVIP